MSNNNKINKQKNKKKNLNKSEKLKLFLDAPIKHDCPILDDEALQKMFDIFESDMKASGESPSDYAKKHNIKIGLESVLRAIKRKECIYILFSKKIKPLYVLTMLSKTVKTIDPAMLDYAHKDVGKYTAKTFGKETMAIAICKQSSKDDEVNFSPELQNWMAINKYERIPPANPRRLRKRKYEDSVEISIETDLHKKVNTYKPNNTETVKETLNAENSDFISVDTKKRKTSSLNSQRILNDDLLNDALQKLKCNAANAEYKPLIIKKIKPNPGKKDKRKII